MLNKLMGMATAPNNIVASLGQPIHMDSAGNNDGFFKARQNNAGYRASVFANPMVREALCAHFNWSIPQLPLAAMQQCPTVSRH